MDLREAEARTAIGLTEAHISGDDLAPCQAVGEAAHYLGREEVIVPSATGKSLSEARAWREYTAAALPLGTIRAPTRTTLAEAADHWLAAGRSGTVRTRSGDPYKPSALRSTRKRSPPRPCPRSRRFPDAGGQAVNYELRMAGTNDLVTRVDLGLDPEADALELEDATIELGEELLELEVDNIERPPSAPPPEGAKSAEVALGATLIVTAGKEVSTAVVSKIAGWVGRGRERSVN